MAVPCSEITVLDGVYKHTLYIPCSRVNDVLDYITGIERESEETSEDEADCPMPNELLENITHLEKTVQLLEKNNEHLRESYNSLKERTTRKFSDFVRSVSSTVPLSDLIHIIEEKECGATFKSRPLLDAWTLEYAQRYLGEHGSEIR